MGTEYTRRGAAAGGKAARKQVAAAVSMGADQSLDAKGDLALAMAPEGQIPEIELPVHSERGRPREEAVEGDPKVECFEGHVVLVPLGDPVEERA